MNTHYSILQNLLIPEPRLDVEIYFIDENGQPGIAKYYKLSLTEYEKLSQRIIVLTDKINVTAVRYRDNKD